jgi:hypothetical protein
MPGLLSILRLPSQSAISLAAFYSPSFWLNPKGSKLFLQIENVFPVVTNCLWPLWLMLIGILKPL